MAKCLIIMNHKPSQEQIKGLEEQFGIKEVLELPGNLRPIWAQIPAEGETFPEDHVAPILSWISKNAAVSDYIWIQGEPAACVFLRNYCARRKLNAILATSRRESIDVANADGSITKKSVFRHVTFRYYP